MKNQTLKFIRLFFFLSSIFFFRSNAQIVYSDIPDQTYNTNNAYYNLDLNNDSINDFRLSVTNLTQGGICAKGYGAAGYIYEVTIHPFNTNSILFSGGNNTPNSLSSNMPIANGSSWSNSSSQLLGQFSKFGQWPNCPAVTSANGNWNNATDKYLGLKINSNGKTYYGWARLNLLVAFGTATFTIKDYAYDTIPNQSIFAGGGSCELQKTISTSGPLTICEGKYISLISDSIPATTYHWYRNHIVIGGANSSMLVTDSAGSYFRSAVNGCGIFISDSVLVQVNSLPASKIIPSGNFSFCFGDSLVLNANAGNNLSYQWKRNGKNIPGATIKKFVAKKAGVYKVVVTNNYGCSKISKPDTISVPCKLSLQTIIDETEYLSVYPNPATKSLTIKFPSDEVSEIQIINFFGQIVLSEKINSDEIKIDVTKFLDGMYVVRWSSGENYETKTFSVVK